MVTQERQPVRLSLFWVGAWAALAFTTAARADFVTPDSIPQPPAAVGSAPLTPIYSPADLVTNQYIGRGLLFPTVLEAPPGVRAGTTAAITNLGGFDVWAPAYWSQGAPWAAEISYGGLTIQLVKPGTTTPTTVRSVTVEVLELPNLDSVGLEAFDREGRILGSTDTPSGSGPHGGVLLTLAASDISSFEVSSLAHVDGSTTGGAPPDLPVWGAAEIEFTPSSAPEPSGLALAVLGAAALAGWMWRLRRNTPAANAA